MESGQPAPRGPAPRAHGTGTRSRARNTSNAGTHRRERSSAGTCAKIARVAAACCLQWKQEALHNVRSSDMKNSNVNSPYRLLQRTYEEISTSHKEDGTLNGIGAASPAWPRTPPTGRELAIGQEIAGTCAKLRVSQLLAVFFVQTHFPHELAQLFV